MPTSTPLLSDAARQLVVPTGIATTAWPSLNFWLQKLGLPFDPWQQGVAKLALGKRQDGVYACTVGGVFLSIPRQVGKTYMIGGMAFALCLLNPGLTVIWTAHRSKTAAETYKSMKGMSRRKAISPYIERTPKNNDEWGIFFMNGSRILFGARENGFGRGFAQVDVLVFDEAQILTDKALDDMIPAMNASKQKAGGLPIFMGTPPKPEDPSEVWMRAREEALSGESDDLLWVEFAPKKRVEPTKWARGFIDWQAFEEANPSYPVRTPREAIMRMSRRLSRESLSREGLGQYDDRAAQATISRKQWDAGLVHEAPEGKPFFGVKFSADGERVSLAAAVTDAGRTHVEVIGQAKTSDPRFDGLLLADWLAGAWRDSLGVGIDGRSGAGALEAELVARKVPTRRFSTLTTAEAVTAHAQMLTAIQQGNLTHVGQPALNAAVGVATKRDIGKLGGWGWQAIGDGDVLDLEAATIALWGANKDKKPTGEGRRVVVM